MDIDLRLKFLFFRWRIAIAKRWVQFAIIVAITLASAIVSYWGSSRILTLLLVLLGGMVVILALLKEPNLGFILMLLGAMFVPFVGPSGVNAAVAMVALMLCLWFLDILASKRKFQLVNSRLILSVVVFLWISVLAFGMGQVPWFTFANQAPLTAQAGGFAIFVLSAGALLLGAHVIQEERWLQIIVWTFVALAAVYIASRALMFSQIDRVYHWGFRNGSMFWTWLIALALSQAIYNNRIKTYFRILLVLLVLLTLYVSVVQAYGWKSGWLPPIVCITVILIVRFKRLTLWAIPIGLFFAATIILTTVISSDEYSWGTRIDAWAIVLKISQVNPLLGLGFSNYYWYTPLFPIRGWAVSFNSHSQYVDLIAQVGILGLFCFVWIFLEVAWLSWRLARELPDGFSQAYAHGVLAGVIGTLFAGSLVDWILPFVYNIGFTGFRASILPWIFSGALVSLEGIYLGKAKSQMRLT